MSSNNENYNPVYMNGEKVLQDIIQAEKEGYKHILIVAPTGSGKTNLMTNHLLPHAIGEQTVFLSNRALLKEQTAIETTPEDIVRGLYKNYTYCYQAIGNAINTILEGEKIKSELKESNIDENEELNNINVEEMKEIIHSCKQFLKTKISNTRYLILDECHYFTSDSEFNDRTIIEYDYLLKNTPKATKIYLTATPDTFLKGLEYFNEMHKTELEKYNINTKLKILRPMENNIVDVKEHNKEHYQIQFIPKINKSIQDKKKHDIRRYIKDTNLYNQKLLEYEQEKYLTKEIKDSNQENKFLYFASDKMFAVLMTYLAKGQTTDNTINGGSFICSLYDNKGYDDNGKQIQQPISWKDYVDMKQRNNLLENNYFDSNVLVATKVLDNGFNINDSKVKRIVIDYAEYDTVVQMIGRVRTKMKGYNNKLNITIMQPTPNEITRKVQEAKNRENKNNNSILPPTNPFLKAQLEHKIKSLNDLRGQGKYNIPTEYVSMLSYYLGLPMENINTMELERYNKYKRDISSRISREKNRIQQNNKRAKKKKEKQTQAIDNAIEFIEESIDDFINLELSKEQFNNLLEDINFPYKQIKKVNEIFNKLGYNFNDKQLRNLENPKKFNKIYTLVKIK
ncbi:DEAD/DEAH box helicase family protein [Peptoniphilus sp. KCTC 25270]|uniref:DEAD/DEAH box helicase family protein n=1 Tax=Peptoniphilus sp. KCTC 25270 TaxID=2897414 RepID=UPI001E4F928F|nr:DEAD/DEAH box helicase [Peptoniphilus sp. KCTC 25270]MCD1146890.1 DEAD/DEAH box helicase family protein [Peptoniphilus sp. KCTC 25270]